MRKVFFTVVLFFGFVCTVAADDLADALQDLAAQIACQGMYSTAETGVSVTSRYEDPPDWYTPSLMAERFASMSGNRTRIETFYGICFDYAEFAWNDIAQYQQWYNDAGMRGQEWYIAAANQGEPNTVILYDPVTRDRATTMANGVYLRERSRHRITTHDGAEGHAWVWVQHNDGTWYWIDPTWTDNTGYVWWGKVENGVEVQYYPEPGLCINPDYPGARAARSEKPRSNTTASTSSGNRPAVAPSYDNYDSYIGYGFMYLHSFDLDLSNWGLAFSAETVYSIFSIEMMFKDKSRFSVLGGMAFGAPLSEFISPYFGGALGAGFTGKTGEGGGIGFSWKVNGGLRFHFGDFFLKTDLSHGNDLGTAFGIGLGLRKH